MLQPLPAGLPQPSLPPVAVADVRALVPGAIALAFLIFAESIVLAQTLAAKRREAVEANTELVALGVANVASGCWGLQRRCERFAFDHCRRRGWPLAARAVGGDRAAPPFMLWLAPLIGRLPGWRWPRS